jgi:hypothetical protein
MSNRVLIGTIERRFHLGHDEKQQAAFTKYISAIISRQMLKIQRLADFFSLKPQDIVFERLQKLLFFDDFLVF